jgi:purine nucleosidase
VRLWIDTDIGTDVDDALAIAYALRHPDLDVVGISTVFGDLDLRGSIVERLLEVAAAPPIPILAGLSVPLTEGRHGLLFGHEGRAVLDDPQPVLRIEHEPGGPAEAQARVDALATALGQVRPDRILAIGPLTNLGALARAGVDLPPLTVMGGKFDPDRPSGLSSRRAEWNWYCDPVAVQHVLGVGDRLDATVVPAEVTFRTALADSDVDLLAGGDPLHRLLAALCREWLRAQDEDFDLPDPRVVLHDPLAAAVLVRPELCTWADRTVTVDDRGQSTVTGPSGGGTTIRAAIDVDPPAVGAELLTVLGAGPS